jgi:hypothetical protein
LALLLNVLDEALSQQATVNAGARYEPDGWIGCLVCRGVTPVTIEHEVFDLQCRILDSVDPAGTLFERKLDDVKPKAISQLLRVAELGAREPDAALVPMAAGPLDLDVTLNVVRAGSAADDVKARICLAELGCDRPASPAPAFRRGGRRRAACRLRRGVADTRSGHRLLLGAGGPRSEP